MSTEDHIVSFSLEINVEEALTNIRQVQAILFRTLSLLRRAGLPENVDDAIAKVQRLIAILNALRLTLIAVQAASGPYGWALAAVGAAGTIATAMDFGTELMGR